MVQKKQNQKVALDMWSNRDTLSLGCNLVRHADSQAHPR